MMDKFTIIRHFIPEAIDDYHIDTDNLDDLVEGVWIKILASNCNEVITFEEVQRAILGTEEVDRRKREIEKRREEENLFKVCHEDGSEWTIQELEDWALENVKNCEIIYCDIYGFYVDEDKGLILADKCGNWIHAERPTFNLVWNKPALQKLLKDIEE